MGTLSGWDEQVFMGVSQNRVSSKSSDIGEYCKDSSSLEPYREHNEIQYHNNKKIYLELLKIVSIARKLYINLKARSLSNKVI